MATLPPDVVRIVLPTPFPIGDVNAYILLGARPTLVDTGPDDARTLRALERGLAEHGLRVEDLELILLTHQHLDHVGQASTLRRRADALVVALRPLDRLLRSYEAAMEQDDAHAVATMLHHGYEADAAETYRAGLAASRRFGRETIVDRILDDGLSLRAGDRDLVALARPGHSPTDTVFFDSSDGLLVGGDHLLREISSNPFDTARSRRSTSRRSPWRDAARRCRSTSRRCGARRGSTSRSSCRGTVRRSRGIAR